MYSISVEEPSRLAMLLIFVGGVGVGAYFFVISLFKVEYAASGFQVTLPGQTVYYVPILPMYDWQDTGIRLNKGDAFYVEVIGYASTQSWGLVIQALQHTLNHTGLTASQKIDILDAIPDAQGFTGPEGIKDTDYTNQCVNQVQRPPNFETWTGDKQIEEVKARLDKKVRSARRSTNKIDESRYSCIDYESEKSQLLVRGLPHNTIVGIIQDPGRGDPKDEPNSYSWDPKDQDGLVNLSSNKYPIPLTAERSGALWVVVNDSAETRWDNSGMYFMSVRLNTMPFSRR